MFPHPYKYRDAVTSVNSVQTFKQHQQSTRKLKYFETHTSIATQECIKTLFPFHKKVTFFFKKNVTFSCSTNKVYSNTLAVLSTALQLRVPSCVTAPPLCLTPSLRVITRPLFLTLSLRVFFFLFYIRYYPFPNIAGARICERLTLSLHAALRRRCSIGV